MQITDPGIIKDGERDLIEAVQDDLDMDAVKRIIQKKMTAAALSSRGGQIVVHNNEIAFRLDFDIQLNGSLMFDRQGNYIPEANDPDIPEESDGALESDDILESDEALEPDDVLEPDEALDSDESLKQGEDDNPDLLDGELNLDDININESLEEVEPETLIDPTDNNEINFDDDELNIDLPDYSDEDTNIEIDDLDQLTDNLELDPAIEEDGDIDDILKDSREFWDQKTDS